MRAGGAGADRADDQITQLGRGLERHQVQQHAAQRIHPHQHPLDVELVGEPPASHGTDDGANVQRDHEAEGRPQAVASHSHQLGQPAAERIDHEQAREEGDPEQHRARASPVLEQPGDRRTRHAVGGGHDELGVRRVLDSRLEITGHFGQFAVAAARDQVGH
ncbi:hypothetical protein SDC9_110378 [bioreactor metagenome]|uniref:Uncharacterized protein n=1 Tax=bioreactor metagenome TaxID=1076179 RepID=A0A645BEL5_9ZZZZ